MNELRQSSEGKATAVLHSYKGLCYLVGPQFRYG